MILLSASGGVGWADDLPVVATGGLGMLININPKWAVQFDFLGLEFQSIDARNVVTDERERLYLFGRHCGVGLSWQFLPPFQLRAAYHQATYLNLAASSPGVEGALGFRIEEGDKKLRYHFFEAGVLLARGPAYVTRGPDPDGSGSTDFYGSAWRGNVFVSYAYALDP